MTTATHDEHYNAPEHALFVAFALRANTGKLGCTTGPGQQPRECTIAARHPARVLQEIPPQPSKTCRSEAVAPENP